MQEKGFGGGKSNEKEDSIDRLFQILFKENEIEWQQILINLVKTEQMDPWDIDIALLSKRLVELITRMQEIDFKVPAKIVLASAILLRLKSERLLEEFLSRFDSLTSDSEDSSFLADFFDNQNLFLLDSKNKHSSSEVGLAPRVPLPRKRKVSIYDLIEALEQVFEMETKRAIRKRRRQRVEVQRPAKKVELTVLIERLYDQLLDFFKKKKQIDFDWLVKSKDKEDIILTFLSLLHLEVDRKIELVQERPFSKITILLNKS